MGASLEAGKTNDSILAFQLCHISNLGIFKHRIDPEGVL
jgi:hypothetical protein